MTSLASLSIHAFRAMKKAAASGGYAGRRDSADIWLYSKRELVEIAIRLGEICADEGTPEAAMNRVREERTILRENGII